MDATKARRRPERKERRGTSVSPVSDRALKEFATAAFLTDDVGRFSHTQSMYLCFLFQSKYLISQSIWITDDGGRLKYSG
jgi:hypothetical protein